MRDDPGLDSSAIAACLDAGYGIKIASIAYLAIGFDLTAAVYEVTDDNGASWFLKIRSTPPGEADLLIPRALLELGILTILAPVPTSDARLWRPLGEHSQYSVVLYPFIRGENAMDAGMSDDQWRAFGATLRAVHDSELGNRFQSRIRSETFSLPSATLVRRVLSQLDQPTFESDAATRFAAFWRVTAGRIRQMLARAEALGRSLRATPFELVLCHGDIHAANILVGQDGRIWLVDWDAPLIAPRERDLLFVIGSKIARPVEVWEEALFFQGYGPVEIDPAALVYYRYERIVEDLGELGKSVILDPNLSEPAREAQVELAKSFFAPGGDIDRAETVAGANWPEVPA